MVDLIPFFQQRKYFLVLLLLALAFGFWYWLSIPPQDGATNMRTKEQERDRDETTEIKISSEKGPPSTKNSQGFYEMRINGTRNTPKLRPSSHIKLEWLQEDHHRIYGQPWILGRELANWLMEPQDPGKYENINHLFLFVF
jgi:hypothetical protein